MTGTFHIALKQEEGFDVHDIREFDLALESKFPIGRASKNQTKGYLLPAKHNVYIDSPVVSREHAILTADAASGKPQVFITDTKSMHGTYVNGTALVPYQARQLSNGDKLQFGVNVNRNESYFMAYKYTFNAELADLEPFSRGFTVPEAESEDEELDSIVRSRGSQLNPLVLDESDAESEPEDEDNAVVLEHSENNLDVAMAHIDEEELVNIDISEDEDVADDVDTGIWSDSESDEASTGSAPEYSPESSLMHEAPHLEEVQVQVAVPVAQAELFQPLSVQWAPVDEQRRATADLFFADFVSTGQPDRPVSQSPHISPSDEPPAATRESTVAPPLPPRPSQKRQRVWDDAVREEQTWHNETSFVPPIQDNGILFQYSAPAVEIEPTPASLPAADRIQTPPHTKLIDAAFAPSTHGSDVVSPGFVDVQPPTPTSINSRKRSADEAFQENTEGSIEEIALTSELEGQGSAQPVSNVDTHDQSVIPTVEEVNSVAHRPIAQPKSILRRVLRAAKVMVPATALGAVFTVTALTTLPESFFTVP